MEAVTPVRSGQEHIAPPDASQKIEDLKNVLNSDPTGPIYQSTHKQLAELLLQSDNEEQAVYHLSESHATTLRLQACYYINRKIKIGKEDCANLQSMEERLSFEGKWHEGVNGLYNRLSELPSEWTVVQLTMEYDPLSRFPPRNRAVNRGLGFYITRLPCGSSPKEILTLGCEWRPIIVFVPALDRDKEELSLMAVMRSHLDKMEKPNKGGNRSKKHDECSTGIEGVKWGLETWLSGWHALLLGKLVDKDLNEEIKSAVELSVFSAIERFEASPQLSEDALRSVKKEFIKTIPSRSFNILYLCASSPLMTFRQICQVTVCLFENVQFAKHLSKEILDIKCRFASRLSLSKRYPVILVVDEDLDILPFETTLSLQDHPVTRMPSIQFLHALYCYHKNTTMKNGINLKNGFYVVNPSNNLPRLDTMFKSLQSLNLVREWKGVLNRAPTQQEFLKGLEESDIFLYCGHGGGNQFISRESVEKAHIKAVVLLLGCCSSSMDDLGGRVEMTSLSNSYLMAGCPCTVGMLWQVLDEDVNAMTQRLLQSWSSVKSTVSNEIDCLGEDFNKLEIHHKKGAAKTEDLCSAVSMAREIATRFLNKAAIVVRGLPVWAMS